MHLLLGDKTQESYRVADFVRYHRAIKRLFLKQVTSGEQHTYLHCEKCDLTDFVKIGNVGWQGGEFKHVIPR
jgi:hypothetical protein